MKARDYFPLGVAQKKAFCNRVEETKWLVGNIESSKHSLLISPRRYGKTSLAYKAINVSNVTNIQIDFSMATSDKKVEKFIVDGVTALIGKAIGPIDKILNSIKKYVSKITPKMVIKAANISLEFDFPSKSDPAVNVKDALLLLEHLLAEKKKRAVMLFDEFQIVGILAKGKGIEGAIRHVAQQTKYLIFIFSGSNRKLLQSMFEDEARPLYKLCKQLRLNRIEYKDYRSHLNKASNEAWAAGLEENIIRKITELSERHPYYLNKLCDIIWTESTTVPTIRNVNDAWQLLLKEEKSDALKDLTSLPTGQKKVLSIIAAGITSKLASKKVVMELDMSPSSISTALQGLEEKDITEQINEHYRIINPIIKVFASKDD